MSKLDFDELLEPVSDEAPCGPDVQSDPDLSLEFQTLQAAAKPPSSTGMFESARKDEKEADWDDIGERTVRLLRKSKNLELIPLLMQAFLRTHGFQGVASVLALSERLVADSWDTLYPDNDVRKPLVLGDLASRERVLQPLRNASLVAVRGVGELSINAIEAIRGADESAELTAEQLTRAFDDIGSSEEHASERERLLETGDAIDDALATVDRLGESLSSHATSGPAADLSGLKQVLREAGELIAPVMTALRGAAEGGTDGGGPDTTEPVGNSPPAAPGRIDSAAAAIQALDRVIDYFEKNEPSSPVPVILLRAKRLVSKSFLEIVEDMAPGGLDEVRKLGGLDTDA